MDTVYNPFKGRLETIDVEYNSENTTWFHDCTTDGEVYMITDFEGSLVIRQHGYYYPFIIYWQSRKAINYDRRKALKILLLHSEEPLDCSSV